MPINVTAVSQFVKALKNGRPFGLLSVTDFGALGDGSDATTAFEACFAAAAHATVVIPNGTYRLTRSITVPEGTSILGLGYDSKLDFFGCDGLTFAIANVISPIVVSNFHINGNGCETFTALRVAGTSDANQRTTGITFDNIYVAFFGTGMSLRGAWHCRIYGVTLNNVYTGIAIRGKSVKNVIDSCSIIRGIITGTGDSRGVTIDSTFDYLPSGTTEGRPEDVVLTTNIVFGFDYAIDYQRCLYGVIEGNDFDNCQKSGIRFQQSDGGLALSNNWIALGASTATRGIEGQDLAFTSVGRVGVRGNHIVLAVPAGQTPDPSSIGIYLGIGQQDVLVEQNDVGGFRNADVYTQYGKFIQIEKNSLRSPRDAQNNPSVYSIYVISSQGVVSFDKNDVAAPIFVHNTSNARVTVGETYGYQSTYLRGRSVIPVGSTSVTTPYSALNSSPPAFIDGPPSFLPASLEIEAPAVNLGALWGTATNTGVTINCTLAPTAGSGPQTIRWSVRAAAGLD